MIPDRAFYFMIELYADGNPKSWTLHSSRQQMSVTKDPVNLYKRNRAAYEKKYAAEMGYYPSRASAMFALWGFDHKPDLDSGLEHARVTAPDVIYTNTHQEIWRLVPFSLHPDMKIEFPEEEQ